MPDDYDDDSYDFDDEYWDEDEFDCGMDSEGYCSMAGSEDCDFECPVMADLIAAERKKKK